MESGECASFGMEFESSVHGLEIASWRWCLELDGYVDTISALFLVLHLGLPFLYILKQISSSNSQILESNFFTN